MNSKRLTMSERSLIVDVAISHVASSKVSTYVRVRGRGTPRA